MGHLSDADDPRCHNEDEARDRACELEQEARDERQVRPYLPPQRRPLPEDYEPDEDQLEERRGR